MDVGRGPGFSTSVINQELSLNCCVIFVMGPFLIPFVEQGEPFRPDKDPVNKHTLSCKIYVVPSPFDASMHFLYELSNKLAGKIASLEWHIKKNPVILTKYAKATHIIRIARGICIIAPISTNHSFVQFKSIEHRSAITCECSITNACAHSRSQNTTCICTSLSAISSPYFSGHQRSAAP